MQTSRDEKWRALGLYILDYIIKNYQLPKNPIDFSLDLAKYIRSDLWEAEADRKIISERDSNEIQLLNSKIEEQMRLYQDDLESKLQNSLQQLSTQFNVISSRNVSYAFVGGGYNGYTRSLLNQFNRTIHDTRITAHTYKANIFIAETNDVHGDIHDRLHNTIKNAYNWANYLFLASNFIADPARRDAFAREAQDFKNEVHAYNTKTASQMIRNEAKFASFGLGMLIAGIVGIALISALASFTLPWLAPLTLAIGLSMIGGFINVFGMAGLIGDELKHRNRRAYFSNIDSRNSALINETEKTLTMTKQKDLSHSTETTRASGKPKKDKKDKSRKSKDYTPPPGVTTSIVGRRHTSTNPTNTEEKKESASLKLGKN